MSPTEYCCYPDCRCPFDAPADPNWCAKGFKHKPALETPAAPVVQQVSDAEMVDVVQMHLGIQIPQGRAIQVARAILALHPAPAAPVALTHHWIAVEAARAGFSPALIATDGGAFARFTRAIERAHGITKGEA